jgi:hypothetical protein
MDAETVATYLTERDRLFLIGAAPCKTGELWTPVAIKVGSHRLTDGGVVNDLGLAVREVLLRQNA